jgi:hypothetical protein
MRLARRRDVGGRHRRMRQVPALVTRDVRTSGREQRKEQQEMHFHRSSTLSGFLRSAHLCSTHRVNKEAASEKIVVLARIRRGSGSALARS